MPTPNGPQNQSRFDLDDDSDFPADLTKVSDYAALVGNRMRGTSAERLELSGPEVWLGLEFIETDTNLTYVYLNNRGTAAWVRKRRFVNASRGTAAGAQSPPPGAVILEQFFQSEPDLNGLGSGVVVFPEPFPSGVGHPFFTMMAIGPAAPVVDGGQITLSQVRIVVPGTTNKSVRIGCHVWGW